MLYSSSLRNIFRCWRHRPIVVIPHNNAFKVSLWILSRLFLSTPAAGVRQISSALHHTYVFSYISLVFEFTFSAITSLNSLLNLVSFDSIPFRVYLLEEYSNNQQNSLGCVCVHFSWISLMCVSEHKCHFSLRFQG